MTNSFQAFRDRFPTAKLTSEILMLQGEHFVVKVTLETDTHGCASGLAAHPTVEVAEDRARLRALQGGGWLGETLPASSSVNNDNTEPSSSPPITSVPSAVMSEQSTAPPAKSLPSPPQHQPARNRERPEESPPLAVSPSSMPSPPAPTEAESSTALDTPLEQTPLTEAELPSPINLSDVIAQTDIELRRLGWSVEAGREYLENTYQKRSRHELSEEELIQFLCHLESL
ncbi:MAG: hypothetical protein ACFBSG_01275 [Leptolyngbyaceae cyanobacterium]